MPFNFCYEFDVLVELFRLALIFRTRLATLSLLLMTMSYLSLSYTYVHPLAKKVLAGNLTKHTYRVSRQQS